jgi:preprotein translocase subunit SecF
MTLKPLFRLSQKMNFHFVKWFKLCLGLSIAAILGTIVLLFTHGLNFGIDFKGGTLIQLETPKAADAPGLTDTLSKLGLGEIKVQKAGAANRFTIQLPEQAGGPDAQKAAAGKVLQAIPAGSKELGSTPGGADLKGGTLIEVETPKAVDAGHLRTRLSELGLGEIQLQAFGADNEFLVRFPEQAGGPEAQKAAAEKVLKAVPEGRELRREQVGSTVSKELINSAIWALVFTNLGIFVYVWFRFEWQFALGAVISLIHDVMFTLGVFSFFRLDFDLTIVAALLTILGYSINDTVVIYDRIRENLRRYKRMPLGDLLDLSVNETMSRTIMTVGTVFMALLALYFFGGEVIRGFTFAMLFGVLVGTYSSVYIAAPFLILIGVKRDWSGLDKGKGGQKPGAAPAAEPILPIADEGDEDEEGGNSKPKTQAEASKAALAAVSARKGGGQQGARGKGQARKRRG